MSRRLTVLVILGSLLLLSGSFVSVGGSDTPSECSVTLSPDQSVQVAIDDARRGDVICLESGTWTESVEIPHSLTLRGVGKERSTLKANTDAEGGVLPNVIVSGDAREVRVISLENLALIGFDATTGLGISLSGSSVGPTRLVATRLRLADHFVGMIATGHDVRVTVRDSTVENHRGDGISGLGNVGDVEGPTIEIIRTTLRNNGTAIHASGSTLVSVDGTSVRNNGSGIAVTGTGPQAPREPRLHVSDSVIADNGRSGQANSLTGGIVLGRNPNDFSFDVPVAAEIERSRISGNQRGIVLGTATDLTLSGSAIQGNQGWGVAEFAQPCFPDLPESSGLNGIVRLSDGNVVRGNNESGNLDGRGNPGVHPFRHLADGQVCLPR